MSIWRMLFMYPFVYVSVFVLLGIAAIMPDGLRVPVALGGFALLVFACVRMIFFRRNRRG